MSNVTDAIYYLNQAALEAYKRDGGESLYGWAYNLAATRLHAALWQEDLKDD